MFKSIKSLKRMMKRMVVKRELINGLVLKSVMMTIFKLVMRSNFKKGTKMSTCIVHKIPLFTFKGLEILKLPRKRPRISFGRSPNAIKLLGTIHK